MTVSTDILTLINGKLEDQLPIIIRNTEKQLLNKLYLDSINLELTPIPTIYNIPEHLEYIVTEVSLIRLGRLGSEGFNSESISGASVNYMLPDTDFNAYNKEIRNFVNRNSDFSNTGGVSFI